MPNKHVTFDSPRFADTITSNRLLRRAEDAVMRSFTKFRAAQRKAQDKTILFITHDHNSNIDRRILQQIDIWKNFGYKVALLTIFDDTPAVKINEAIGIEVLTIKYSDFDFDRCSNPILETVTVHFFLINWLTAFKEFLIHYISKSGLDKSVKVHAKIIRKILKKLSDFTGVAERAVFKVVLFFEFKSFKAASKAFQVYSLEENIFCLTKPALTALEGRSFQFVICADLPSLPAGVVLKNQGRCDRLIYDSHELYVEQQVYSWGKKFVLYIYEKVCLRFVDYSFSVSSEAAKFLSSVYDSQKPFNWISNAPSSVDSSVSGRDLRSLITNKDSDIVILFHGSITAERGIDLLINAVKKNRRPDLHLAILGYCSDEFLEHLKKLAGDSQVHFFAAVPQKELLGFIRNIDYAVVPYPPIDHNHRNSTPNKLYDCIEIEIPLLYHTGLETITKEIGSGSFAVPVRFSDPMFLAEDFMNLQKPDKRAVVAEVKELKKRFGWPTQATRYSEWIEHFGRDDFDFML